MGINKTYTLEDLEEYIHRMHYVTVTAVIINLIAAILVWKYSTPAMSNYKYYILSTILCAFLMDFHVTFIFGAFPIFPTPPTICAAGLTKGFGIFWGETLQFALMHLGCGLAGISVLTCFAYQYYSLVKNADFFHSKKGVFLITSATILFPTPSIALNLIVSDRETSESYIKEKNPRLYEFYMIAPCNSAMYNPLTVFYLAVATAQIVGVYVVTLILAQSLYKNLERLKQSMSHKTLQARKQILMALMLQVSIPLTFVIIPTVTMITIVTLKMESLEEFCQWTMMLWGLHSSANSLSIIFVIRPYREALVRWIWAPKKFFMKFIMKKTMVKDLTSSGPPSNTVSSITNLE